MSLYIYLIFFIFSLAILFGPISYKKDTVSKLNKKEHPLKFLYGSAFLYIDIYRKTFLKGKKSNKQIKRQSRLSSLHVGQNPEALLYFDSAKKISFSILIFTFAMFIGLGYSLSLPENNEVTFIDRPPGNNGSLSEDLIANIEGETSHVTVNVDSKEYTFEEVLNIFDAARESIEISLLGDNNSFEEISSKLNLINNVDDIKTNWSFEDSQYFNYDGSIRYNNIPLEGVRTIVYGTLSFADYSAEITIPIFILPYESEDLSFNQELQSAIDTNNDSHEPTVHLPTSINGFSVSFFKPQNDLSPYFF